MTTATACGGAFAGQQNCDSSGCGYDVCGGFDFNRSYAPGGPSFTHGCGRQCGFFLDPDWCVTLDPGSFCDAITAGPGEVVPPGRYTVEIDWNDTGAWTFAVFGGGVELGRRSEVNTDDSRDITTQVEVTVSRCMRLDLQVSGGPRIEITDIRFTRTGDL